MSNATLFTELSAAESADVNGGDFTVAIDLAAWLLSPSLGAAAGLTDPNLIAQYRLGASVRTLTTFPSQPPIYVPKL